jgi:hypothetical protein
MTLATRRGVPASLSADEQLPRVDWNDLGPEFFAQWGRPNGRFEPEHLTVYGRSGSGKTHFVGYALSERHRLRGSHVTAVATKRADATLTRLGWPVIGDWPPNYGDHCVIFWAKAKGISQIHRVPQKAKVKGLMNALWRPGANMVVYWDELTYVQSMLRLGPELETFYREGRTHGITNVASMQRPSNVTRLAHSEAGWTVAFPPKDADDRTRIAEVLGDRTFYRAVLAPRSRRNPLGLDSTVMSSLSSRS